MRLIRFLLLALIVGVSYTAQSVFDQRHLSDLLTFSVGSFGMLGDLLPGLQLLNRMSTDELLIFGMFVVLITSIGFGLVSSRWLPSIQVLTSPQDEDPFNPSVSNLADSEVRRSGLPSTLGLIGTVIALALVLGVTAQVSTFGLDTPLLHAAWLGGLLLFLSGSLLMQRGRHQHNNQQSDRETIIRSVNGVHSIEIRPMSGWPILLVILFGAMILYLWQLWQIPARIDHVVAEVGLQSLSILRGETNNLFFPGATGLPMLAYIPAALAIQLTGDPLFGVRLAGVGTGLLMIVGTWLLSCELFRRVPRFGDLGTIIEDDGRWIALMAALLVAFGHVTLHFSRLPVYLGPVVWGTFGLWAMLRGLRCQHLPSLALSGMMIGLASVLYAGGLYFLLVTPLWWIGVWLLQRHWFYAKSGHLSSQGFSGQVAINTSADERFFQKYTGNQSFLFWLGGVALVVLPFFAVWGSMPEVFDGFLRNDYLLLQPAIEARNQAMALSRSVEYLFLDNLRLTLFTFNIYPNNGLIFDIASPFLNRWLAPLLFLGLGALVLNLDRLLGWLLLVSIVVGITLGAVGLNVPFWLRLLSITPMIAIVIAFTIDRIRVTLLETAGAWLEQTTVYLALGFIVWTSLQGWLTYYDYGLRQDAPSSHVGRAIQSMGLEQTAILMLREGNSPVDNTLADSTSADSPSFNAVAAQSLLQQNGLDATIIDFIASDINGPRARMSFEIGKWPETLPKGTRLLIQPGDRGWLGEIEQRYGEGELVPVRNLRGDPVLYIYDIW